jgi:putative transposase
MPEIISLLQCITCVDSTTLRRLTVIVSAMLAMTGRVTMLGISRWAEEGGSYRTIQRFFNTDLKWDELHWQFVKQVFLDLKEVYIIAGDEVVVTKAGTETHGLGKFYSSIRGKVVPSLSYFTFSLVNTSTGASHPLMTRQQLPPETKPTTELPPTPKRGRGRPKGSQNKNKSEVVLSPYWRFIQEMLSSLLLIIGIDVRYIVLDGAFGNHYAYAMIKKCGSELHLISKMKYNSIFYFPFSGTYSGRGPHPKYGHKFNSHQIPADYLKESSTEEGIRTDIYQLELLHTLFPHPLNIVLIRKTQLETGVSSQVILFSSDLTLSHTLLIHYYRLRFQIEFNFRDAKQFWGLEDFMTVNETPVTNSANLAFFMVNVAQALIHAFRQQNDKFSANDLKAHFRGLKYATEVLKLLPEKPDPILMTQILTHLTALGAVNTP